MITYGMDMLIGAQVAGQVFNSFLGNAEALTLSQWDDFWWIPALFAGVILILFIFTFNDKIIEDKENINASGFKV